MPKWGHTVGHAGLKYPMPTHLGIGLGVKEAPNNVAHLKHPPGMEPGKSETRMNNEEWLGCMVVWEYV